MTRHELKQQILLKGERQAAKIMEKLNYSYRSGSPLITDDDYDDLKIKLGDKFPENPAFSETEVESELGAVEGKVIKLPQRMLSTNKAYSITEIEKWACNVVDAGKGLGLSSTDIFFRITPKLDGFAAFDDGKTLYTRGDGRSGTDITRAIDNGLQVSSGIRGMGAGEIVVDKEFFTQELSSDYENTRNVIAGAIKQGDLDDKIEFALGVGAIYFQPFSELNGWIRDKHGLINDLEGIWDSIKQLPYETDGLVIEAQNDNIKGVMGSTNHHHKWQIAYKKNTEFHNIRVIGVKPQTSKNGRITPVVELEPTKVSGVTISNATGHHYGNIIEKGIDVGAIVRVCRSGQVIPYIDGVVSKVDVNIPDECPSCCSATELVGDNLICTNSETCPAQIEKMVEFFFKTLGNCDGFGPKVIQEIHNYCKRVDSPMHPAMIYAMSLEDFKDAGFGEKTSANLVDQLAMSRRIEIEDWRFLAAFSIHNVGKGGCERLLGHHRLSDVFDLKVDDITVIDDLGVKKAASLISSLKRIKPMFDTLMGFGGGFTLLETPLLSEKVETKSPIAGLSIVFTGTMKKGKRGDMEGWAKTLGAKVGSSVTSKTDMLVCGGDVGESKINSARKNGTRILSESEYLNIILGDAI